MYGIGRIFPAAVEVITSNVASKITIDNSVYVQHWEDVQVVALKQLSAVAVAVIN
jgi:hypothetical protein